MKEKNKNATHAWNQVRISVGVAAYNPKEDLHIDEVIAHADTLMYKDKEKNKKKNDEEDLA